MAPVAVKVFDIPFVTVQVERKQRTSVGGERDFGMNRSKDDALKGLLQLSKLKEGEFGKNTLCVIITCFTLLLLIRRQEEGGKEVGKGFGCLH